MNQERGTPMKVVEITKDNRGKVATSIMFYINIEIIYLWCMKYYFIGEPSTIFNTILNVITLLLLSYVIIGMSFYLFYNWNTLKNIKVLRYEL